MGGSSSSSGGGSLSYDMGPSALTNLYNQPVTRVEHVERPLGSSGVGSPVTHEGVRVTTRDGGQYLVHKGSGFGRSSETVVVDAKHMSDRWQVIKSEDMSHRNVNVSKFVEAGGPNYSLFFDNCKHAAERMSNAGKP